VAYFKTTLTDQIYIKAQRIRSLQKTKIDEDETGIHRDYQLFDYGFDSIGT
jgi:hypothetical protein